LHDRCSLKRRTQYGSEGAATDFPSKQKFAIHLLPLDENHLA
jgi:hypothetical protein